TPRCARLPLKPVAFWRDAAAPRRGVGPRSSARDNTGSTAASIPMPRLSIVIASYNHAPFVQDSLRSVLQQDYQDFEILVTDDGSSDGTPDQVRAVQDPRIALQVLPENRGACIAMNEAIRRARGEFIVVLNSDDVFLPGKLSRQL